MALLFCGLLLRVRIPPARAGTGGARRPILAAVRTPQVALSALLIFFSVAPDFGFSSWLAEYFRSGLAVSPRLSSAVVSVYLAGIISGRWLTSRLVRRLATDRILCGGLALALLALPLLFLLPVGPKVAAIYLYGLGMGPVFPLLMALGTRACPDQPGVATGTLFGALSAGGMVFPLLMGAVAARAGIARAFWLPAGVLAGLLVTLLLWGRAACPAAWGCPPAGRPPEAGPPAEGLPSG
jgi:fucose permease